jgi:hypothetical protein
MSQKMYFPHASAAVASGHGIFSLQVGGARWMLPIKLHKALKGDAQHP